MKNNLSVRHPSFTQLCLLIAAFCFASTGHAASLLFNNGSVDPFRPTWNNTDPTFSSYEQFSLSATTTITGIDYSIFKKSSAVYAGSFVSILDHLGTSPTYFVPEFYTVGSLIANGLSTTNPAVPTGFDVSLTGLSLTLGPGTYYLGLRTDIVGGDLASIGSGAGSGQTISTGLFQGFPGPGAGGLRTGDHMAFKIYGGAESVPDGASTLGLLGLGLTAVVAWRRRVRD